MNKAAVFPGADAVAYRSPMPVSLRRGYRSAAGEITFPVCPRCQITMEREYQRFCDRCGQALDWKDFSKSMVVICR